MNQAYDLCELRARVRKLLNKDDRCPAKVPVLNHGLWAVPLIEELAERVEALEAKPRVKPKPRRRRKKTNGA